jgi:ribonuclease BN (tRNA processing enzyme)
MELFMKLIFLGTRGGIKARSPEHYLHSSLLIKHGSFKLMIDCGKDWLHRVNIIQPSALLLTHAHDDHAGGLSSVRHLPIYATEETLQRIKKNELTQPIALTVEKAFRLGPFVCTAFALEHSLLAPAVGYRIELNKTAIFYAPDSVSIINQAKALKDISAYIGDGAVIDRHLLIRHHNAIRTGHVPISEQLAWCQKAQIPKMIITHCGTEIVTGDPLTIRNKLMTLAHHSSVRVTLAYDGMTIIIRKKATA